MEVPTYNAKRRRSFRLVGQTQLCPSLAELPAELLDQIQTYLDIADLLAFRATCVRIQQVCDRALIIHRKFFEYEALRELAIPDLSFYIKLSEVYYFHVREYYAPVRLALMKLREEIDNAMSARTKPVEAFTRIVGRFEEKFLFIYKQLQTMSVKYIEYARHHRLLSTRPSRTLCNAIETHKDEALVITIAQHSIGRAMFDAIELHCDLLLLSNKQMNASALCDDSEEMEQWELLQQKAAQTIRNVANIKLLYEMWTQIISVLCHAQLKMLQEKDPETAAILEKIEQRRKAAMVAV
eukprot:Colp12_sorted_trinity150504_noHs@27146